MADFFSSIGINSGTAAVGIMAHSLTLKMLTTIQFRAKLTLDPKTPQASHVRIYESRMLAIKLVCKRMSSVEA